MQPVFLLSLPRSGSTLLQRLLAARQGGAIVTRSEPWIVLPFCQGFYEEEAITAYQQDLSHAAIDEFLSEQGMDRIQLMRGCLDSIYARYATGSSRYFLDKTPRYILVTECLMKLYPDARYIVLWRNPLACLASQSNTWKQGRFYLGNVMNDYHEGLLGLLSVAENEAIKKIEVRYEDLVENISEEVNRIFEFLDLDRDDEVNTNYKNIQLKGEFGDPLRDKKYQSVTNASLSTWEEFFSTPLRYFWAKKYLDWIGQDRLARMGYDLSEIESRLSIRRYSGFRYDGVPMLKEYVMKRINKSALGAYRATLKRLYR